MIGRSSPTRRCPGPGFRGLPAIRSSRRRREACWTARPLRPGTGPGCRWSSRGRKSVAPRRRRRPGRRRRR
ncbi:hypothetical protein ACFFX0_18875 [Citricoccus parietis]|uniref:Uncharacterized protein n=1 Tax=Citricoccus parietis TaxID=592307 RepID=A0ABV5G2J0_9MICC